VALSAGSDDFKGKLRMEYYAYDALNELFHVAGSKPSSYSAGTFSDHNLGKVALEVWKEMGPTTLNQLFTLPTDDPRNDPYGHWSGFFHGIVGAYCKKEEMP
jgi:hypothetical protein